jgi:formate/nitrite transporter FocA (FNT family)
MTQKSIAGGLAIGIACLVNLKLGELAGAIFFTIGLLTICINQLDLITGKGTAIIEKSLTAGELIEIFTGNLFGIVLVWACILGTTLLPSMKESAMAIVANRVATPWYGNITKSILCGICI